MASTRPRRLAGIIAILAAIAGIAADLILQYTPNSAHLLSESLIALDVSPARLLVGHYLGIAAILLETAGIWQVYGGLRPAGQRVALPFLLVYAAGIAVGAAFHGTFVFVALAAQAQQGTTGAAYQSFSDLIAAYSAPRIGLLAVAVLTIVIGSLWYSFAVGFRQTAYPGWMAWLTPLTFVIVLGLLGRAIPPLGLVIAPTALNLSHLAFFVVTTAAL